MRSALLFLGLSCSPAFSQHLGPNPALPGDHPDPSIIRDDRTYWATSTSGDWAPLFPIFSSTDLSEWKQTGAVFQETPKWASGDFWAPEIVSDKGGVKVYYAARKRGGPLCVAAALAARPSGPYKDHGPIVCQRDGSIDPAFIRDEKGHPYLIWKEDGNSIGQRTYIWAQPLDDAGTHVNGLARPLLFNDAPWEGKVVEAPYLFWRKGWIYMLYAGGACCGRGCSYGVGIARSHHLLGPWDKDPNNPIVAGNDEWKCPGHGSAVVDRRGRQYFLYHAYSTRDDVYVGRQAVLDRMDWNADGWPAINRNHGVGVRRGASPAYNLSWDFTSAPDLQSWQWDVASKPLINVSSAGLLVSPSDPTNYEILSAFLGQETRSLNYTAEAALKLNPPKRVAVGVAVVGDSRNALGIAIIDGKVTTWSRRGGAERVLATVAPANERQLYLRIKVDRGNSFVLSQSADGKTWNQLGEVLDANSIAPWDLGVRVGLSFGAGDRATVSSFTLFGAN